MDWWVDLQGLGIAVYAERRRFWSCYVSVNGGNMVIGSGTGAIGSFIDAIGS